MTHAPKLWVMVMSHHDKFNAKRDLIEPDRPDQAPADRPQKYSTLDVHPALSRGTIIYRTWTILVRCSLTVTAQTEKKLWERVMCEENVESDILINDPKKDQPSSKHTRMDPSACWHASRS